MDAVMNIDSSQIAEDYRQEIDQQIEKIISRHKNNRYEINCLVFESVTALTASENASEELASQGIIKRLWGGITGKNNKLQEEIRRNQMLAQYASQQTLQKLAEQNLMSFELIAAVNNKLNSSLVEVETEINTIYGTLVTFFKKTRSDIIQLENRVERLEKNVRLLNWQNSIEYQMYNGVEYCDLDDVEKIICLVRDFYDLTQGKWTTSDLLLLKAAMSSIDLSPRKDICYRPFINRVASDPQLLSKLFDGMSLKGIEKFPEYVAISAGIEKRSLLAADEKYLVESTVGLLNRNGCEVSADVVSDQIVETYEYRQARFNVDGVVNCYDFILELLYNLMQVQEIQYTYTLDEKMRQAEVLFSVYDAANLIPLLNELADHGSAKAKYMLALLYETGCDGLERDDKKCQELLDESMEEGYVPAITRKMMPLCLSTNNEIEPLWKENYLELQQMADEGDMFAAEEYARSCINLSYLKCGENDYETAIKMFKKAPLVLSYYGLAKRYNNGQGVEKDFATSLNYYEKAAQMQYNPAEYEAGRAYQNGWGCDINKEKAFKYYVSAEKHGNYDAINQVAWCLTNNFGTGNDYARAFALYQKGEQKGIAVCVSNLGWCYRFGNGVQQDYKTAIEKFKSAIELNEKGAYSYRCLADLYYNGQGVPVNREEAKKLYQKAADLGDEDAKKSLREKF
ncbi:MAG: hypothetical protein LUH53_11715 [Lachnospiraceae bacterium]|nr:hypothetical protein [Lachnospiraceae bacterium]